jgi:hypothetical protein
MPTRAIERITSWSFSRYETYKECPLKAKLKFIDRKKEPGSVALDRGNLVHKLAEDYTLGKIKKLPEELKLFKGEFAMLKKTKAAVETTLAFRSDWTPTTYDDWKGCWVRIKTDAMYVQKDVVTVIDHKTGQPRDISSEQMELYGLGALLAVPQAKVARADLYYLDKGIIKGANAEDAKPGEWEYKRADVPLLKKAWEVRVKPMLTDTRFAARPGNYCKWCHFRKSNGGPCKW